MRLGLGLGFDNLDSDTALLAGGVQQARTPLNFEQLMYISSPFSRSGRAACINARSAATRENGNDILYYPILY